MKKVLVCALAVLFLMATCLTAFAVDYTTTTTYDTTGKLKIETTVIDPVQGEMYTYLAYKGEAATPADDDIIYIDQQTYDGEAPVKFSYTSDDVADIAALSNVAVKSGSSDSDSAEDLTAQTQAAQRTITVVCGTDSTKVQFPSEVTANTTVPTNIDIPDNDGVTATVTSEGDANDAIDYSTGKLVIKDNAILTHGCTLTVTITPKTEELPPEYDDTADLGGMYVGYSSSKLAEKLCLFGIAPAGVTEYGIIITDEDITDAAFTFDAAKEKFAGKHKNTDGQFAVQLVKYMIDENDTELTKDTLKARTYVKGENGLYAYGKVFTFVNGLKTENN